MHILTELSLIFALCLAGEGIAALLPVAFPASVISLLLLLILLLPLPMTRNDGGSIDFCAVLYRCTVWHQINPAYQDGPSTEPKFLTGVSFAFFPFHFIQG